MIESPVLRVSKIDLFKPNLRKCLIKLSLALEFGKFTDQVIK